MKVEYAPAANHDLRSIADWIAQDNPARAESFAVKLWERRQSLAQDGRRYAVAERTCRHEYRKLNHGAYLIFYELFDDHVVIARIVHHKPDWPKLLPR